MPPSIEMLDGKPVRQMRSFAVNFDTPGDLNLQRFDRLVRVVSGDDTLADLKWVVRGSGLVVFDKSYQHIDFNDALSRQLGNTEPLHAAGYLNVIFLDPTVRVLSGWSISLRNVLERNKSDAFKKEVLGPRLGSGFIVK